MNSVVVRILFNVFNNALRNRAVIIVHLPFPASVLDAVCTFSLEFPQLFDIDAIISTLQIRTIILLAQDYDQVRGSSIPNSAVCYFLTTVS